MSVERISLKKRAVVKKVAENAKEKACKMPEIPKLKEKASENPRSDFEEKKSPDVSKAVVAGGKKLLEVRSRRP